MAEHKFRVFLLSRDWGPVLDLQFVAQARADDTLPDPVSWAELEAYIKQASSAYHPETLLAANQVWQTYVEER